VWLTSPDSAPRFDLGGSRVELKVQAKVLASLTCPSRSSGETVKGAADGCADAPRAGIVPHNSSALRSPLARVSVAGKYGIGLSETANLSNPMSGVCAYCSRAAQLTREHVVPNFLYRQNPQAKLGFNPKADQFIFGEVQIKDVCATCNSEHLGRLDAYASQFYEANEIGHLVTTEKKVRIAYDYALLSRFLLKVTFNCLRFKGDDTRWLKPFSDYILYGVDHPTGLDFCLGVEVTRCHKITKADRAALPPDAKAWQYIPPHTIRIGQLQSREIASDFVSARYISLNNFFFYLIIGKRRADAFSAIPTFIRHALPHVTLLDPATAAMTLKVSSVTALMRYEATGLSVMNKWLEYMCRSQTK
jgi:hypothetical protein